MRNLRAVPCAAVFHEKAHTLRLDREVPIGKTCIGESEAEGMVEVAHIEALAVLRAVAAEFPVGIGRGIRKRARIALRELPHGRSLSVQKLCHGARPRLAAEVAVQHGARIPLDREIHDRTRAQHEDDVRIDIREAVKHPPLCRR